jgi:PAS domain S-box-containing protein
MPTHVEEIARRAAPAASIPTAASMHADPAARLTDPARLAVLREAAVASPAADPPFDRLARIALRALDVPIAYLSFVDGERQYYRGAAGLGEPLATRREIELEHSVCRHVVVSGCHLCVGDAEAHPLTAGNPLLAALGVRAYAAVPLVARGGHVLGTLCVCDTAPRRWSVGHLELMHELGALAVDEVERRREAARRAPASALKAAESLFKPLVEQSLAGIYVVQDGVFRYVNPRLAEVFGYPHEHFDAPRPVMDFVHQEDRPLVEENIRRRLSGEARTIRYRFRAVRADGSLLHLEVHGSRTELDGRPALIGVGLDVTEQVRAEREREAAMTSRDRFYAMMSHELRTPVSAIMLYNELLLTGVYEALNRSQREALERAQRSARHLLELINDLLDLSKLQAGKLERRVEDVDLADVVEDVAAELAALALEQRCELRMGFARRPLVLTSDGRRVRQIMVNLLSNALKFGRGHPVEVRCRDEPDGVVAEVTDHGPGIAPEDVERIFEDFVQVAGGEETGTGLGLPLARRLATLLGGTLEVRSVPGRGSTFLLCLPHAPPLPDRPFPAA